jgi:hypothetical protein
VHGETRPYKYIHTIHHNIYNRPANYHFCRNDHLLRAKFVYYSCNVIRVIQKAVTFRNDIWSEILQLKNLVRYLRLNFCYIFIGLHLKHKSWAALSVSLFLVCSVLTSSSYHDTILSMQTFRQCMLTAVLTILRHKLVCTLII